MASCVSGSEGLTAQLSRARRLPVVLALMAAATIGLAACGSDGDGEDAAARLARSEIAGLCDAPPLAPATLTPLGLNPLGAIATLTAQPDPAEAEGGPSEQVAREVIAAAKNFVNCWNQRRFEEAVALTTEDYRKAHFVLRNSADILVVLDGAPNLPYQVRFLGDPQQHPDGRVSVAIEYDWVHQQVDTRWYFLKRDGRWLFDQETRSHVDLGVPTTTVDIEMTEFAYNISQPVIQRAPAVELRVSNTGGLPHEVFLVKLTSDIDPTKLFQPGVKPEGVEFWGHEVVMAGDSGEITIADMTPGEYIMVCQFRFPGGDIVTHSAAGMVAVLRVE